MSRWIGFIIAILVGIGLGLLYGWVVSPVDYVDTTPESLRQDYQADYVLMVAETYQLERDPALAVARLTFIGEGNPSLIVLNAINFAKEVGYSQSDQARLQLLLEGVEMFSDSSQGETP